MAANQTREFDRERGAAGHMLDGVILDLAGLQAKTKHEPTRLLLNACIEACQRVNQELKANVALLAHIAEDPDGIGMEQRALALVMGLPEDEHMVRVLRTARLTIAEVIRQQTEVPA